MIAVGSSLIHQGGILLYNPLTNKVVTRRTFKQLGPADITSTIPNYTVDYEEEPQMVSSFQLLDKVQYKLLLKSFDIFMNLGLIFLNILFLLIFHQL